MIEQIDGINAPFIVHFVKADGSIRQMVAIKRNKMQNRNGTAVKKSKFKYSLRENNLLLIQELATFQTRTIKKEGTGTVHRLIDKPDIDSIRMASIPEAKRLNKSIKINSIIQFNNHKVWA